MSAARHLRIVDTETGELHEEGDCAKCADARAEAETWKQEVLKLKRDLKREREDNDEKMRRDKFFPAAIALIQEWKTECGHPNSSEDDPKRIRLAMSVVKRYKDDRDKLSLVIQHGKHLAFVNDDGFKFDEFGRLFGSSDEIEKRATQYWLWQKKRHPR